jgi:hypothetical protein
MVGVTVALASCVIPESSGKIVISGGINQILYVPQKKE